MSSNGGAVHDRDHAQLRLGRYGIPGWRREALRTTLWIVPTIMVVLAVGLFAVTYALDIAAAHGHLTFPGWVSAGSADAARQILIAIAAAIITVVGLVFSITILALQLASQQFGPRMLRNFIRDLGTQISLGTFVGTFVYSMLTLGSIGHLSPTFVPHLSVTIALGLMIVDLGVLIYFIHHVATSIQLTSVVAGIARDFRRTLATLHQEAAATGSEARGAGSEALLVEARLEREGASVPAWTGGFLQAAGHGRLVDIAASCDAVILLLRRPGQFLAAGQPLAVVRPASAAPEISRALTRAHIIGPNRTLTQDLGFAVDQLVEVAIRALSPAVNDTFTALNCIDWLGDCLCRVAGRPLPAGIYRGRDGTIRVIDRPITFERLVKAAFDKIRQAARGMPAVLIRQLQNLEKVAMALRDDPEDAGIIARHAEMILRVSEESVPEALDREGVRAAYEALVARLEKPGRVAVEAEELAPPVAES